MYVSLQSEYCALRPIGHGVGSMCVYPALNSLLKLESVDAFEIVLPVLSG